jgi:hypothetical protein
MSSVPTNQPPQLPLGTYVVLREPLPDADGVVVRPGVAGRIAEVTADGRYLVRFAGAGAGAGAGEVVVGREQVSLFRSYQREIGLGALSGGLSAVAAETLVREHTIYAAVVGSRAFGLDTEHSDTDTRGVYVVPTPGFWSLSKPPSHIEGPEPEWFSWEVERFCELALKANPNLLEVLYSPLPVRSTPLGEELLGLRTAFLSQLAYQTYSGYAMSQFKKLETDLRRRGEPKWKHVMHLLRLLLSVRHLLLTGEVMVDVGENRERLLAVRSGEWSWERVERWRLELHAQVDQALVSSPLPAVPDVVLVDDWLYSVRRRGAGMPTI